MLANRIENLAQALEVVNARGREFAELYAPLEKALQEQQAAARSVAQLFGSRERAAKALAQAYGFVKSCAANLKEDALKAADGVPALVGDLAEILRQLAECAESHERVYGEQAMACLLEANDIKEEKEEAERHVTRPL